MSKTKKFRTMIYLTEDTYEILRRLPRGFSVTKLVEDLLRKHFESPAFVESLPDCDLRRYLEERIKQKSSGRETLPEQGQEQTNRRL